MISSFRMQYIIPPFLFIKRPKPIYSNLDLETDQATANPIIHKNVYETFLSGCPDKHTTVWWLERTDENSYLFFQNEK